MKTVCAETIKATRRGGIMTVSAVARSLATLVTAAGNTLHGARLSAACVLAFLLPFSAATAAQTPVVLGTSGNFAILAKTGISTVPTSAIVGDMGVSPIAATAITGFGALPLDVSGEFSTSPQVVGRIYASDYTEPTPTKLTTAVLNMQAAYVNAAGRALPDHTELSAGNIGGLTLAPGLYKWSTGVTIPLDVTLSGDTNAVWIFQIAGDLTMASAKNVILTGGARAANVFWQVGGGAGVTIGTYAHFEGIVLSLKAIHLLTGASFSGRLLAQTAVTLDGNAVTEPQQADLSLTKTVDNATPILGTNVMFTITVTNSGPDIATNVTVRDVLPVGLGFVSASNGIYTAGSGIWTIGTLDVGATTSLLITATVTNSGVVIPNTAQVWTSDTFDPDSAPGNSVPAEDDQQTVTLTVAAAADLELTKGVNNTTPSLGGQVTYTITVTNRGPFADAVITVRDILPAGVSFVSASDALYNPGTGMWGIGSLASGASTSLTIVVTVTALGSITNVAQVWTAQYFDPDSAPANSNPNEDDQGQAVIAVRSAADLALSKSVDDATPDLGSNVVFTIIVTNAGPSTATGVSVLDLLPAGLTYVTNGPGVYTATNGLWTIGTLGVGSSTTLQITATAVASGTIITNIAQVWAADQPDPDSTPANNNPLEDDQGQAMVSAGAAAADLSLTKTVDNASPGLGSNVVFTITVTNSGPDAATNVTVRDVLPRGLRYVTNSVGVYTATNGLWVIGTLNVGSNATLQLTATVTNSGVAITNIAQVWTAGQFDPDSVPANSNPLEDDQAAAIINAGGAADLALSKTVDNASPSIGSNVMFTITVTNSGPNAATGVTVMDLLPVGLRFVGASGGVYASGSGLWTLGTLNVGASTTLVITATVSNAGVIIQNTAQVWTSSQVDPDSTPGNSLPLEDDQGSVALVVPSASDLMLTKTVNNPTPTVGSQVTYTIVVMNLGPNADTAITVQDILPIGVNYATNSGTGYDPSTGIWDIGNLNAGASATLTITAYVYASGVITNTALILTSGNFNPPGNDRGQAIITVPNPLVTPVTLKYFHATDISGGVQLEWLTGVELENLGFNLYRSESAAGPRTQVNPSLIPGVGSSVGQVYRSLDATADPAQTYYYWLEDVSWSFQTKLHGPAIRWGAGDSGRQAHTLGTFTAAGIGGLYRITYDALESSGLPVESLDPATLAVRVNGQETAAYVDAIGPVLAPGDFILFYAPESTNGLACELVVVPQGVRMGTAFARPSRAPGSVYVDLAGSDQYLNFQTDTNCVRYMLMDFVGVPVWVVDVTSATNTVMMFGYSYVNGADGRVAVHMSYSLPSGPARCLAVQDSAVIDIGNIVTP